MPTLLIPQQASAQLLNLKFGAPTPTQNCPRGSGFGDGCTGAPGISPQLPTLLNGFVARPAWNVAGVDYGVGVTPGTTIRVATQGNIPAGCTIENGALKVANNVTLNGYDLSGLTVLVQAGVTGTITISNCIGTITNVRTDTGVSGVSIAIRNCVIDGGGEQMDPDFQTIKVYCPLDIRYSWVKHGPAAIYGPQTTALYNLFQGFGLTAAGGGHCNAIYSIGGNLQPITIQYNTFWTEASQTAGGFPIGLGASIAFFGDGGSYTSTNASNNVQVGSLPGGVSIFQGYYLGGSETGTGGVAHNNYFGLSGSGDTLGYFIEEGSVTGTSYSGNINMNTGATITGP